MRRTQDEAEQTRQDLLEAALAIFSRKGYQSATLNDIARTAGVTRGAIYHHFGSKEDLFIALIEDASTQGNVIIQQAIGKGKTVIEIIEYILVDTMHLLEDNQRFREVMALSFTNYGMEAFVQRRAAEAQTLPGLISEGFRPGVASGEFRSDLDPETAARAMISYQNGLAMLWLANPNTFSIKQSALALAEIFINGIAEKK